MAATTTSRVSRPRGSVRRDLVSLSALTLAMRLPGFLAERHLTFDDGVYGASAVAMRAGGLPFREVFSSQGPLFLPLLYLADLLGLRTVDAPRLLSVAAGLALVGATYLAGRTITDRAGALVAAGVVATTATMLWITGPIAADGVALAFATLTVMLTLRWRHDITTARAVALGLGVGATVSVKALLAPVILPVALVLLAGRRFQPVLVGAATAVAFHLALWLPWGPANVWDQSYGYHLSVSTDRTPGRNLAKILSTLGDRDAIVVAGVVCMVVTIAGRRQARVPAREARLTAPDTLLLAWLAGTLVVLLTESPLWRPHVSQVIPALVLLAARHRPPARALLAVALVVVPYHLVHAWPILHPSPYSAQDERMLTVLRGLPAGARAMSDDPGIVWRAGRLTPPDLVDTSILRIQANQITSASLASAARAHDVCAVVVLSTVRWGSFDDLPDRLAREGYRLALDEGPGRRAYVRSPCHPG